MLVKQISIIISNEPGRLYEITTKLGELGINIKAICVTDTSDFGILRMIVDQPDEALNNLAGDIPCIIAEVLLISLSNEPGYLSEIISLLYNEKINVEYMYAAKNVNDTPSAVLKTSDIARTIEIFSNNNIKLLSVDDI